MGNAEEMINAAVAQVKELLTTDRVVGKPIQIGDVTIIPLVSIGFGFGGGSGTDEDGAGKNTKDGGGQNGGNGQGAGAGGGVKPVALVISDAQGVRVEPVKSVGSSLASSISDIVRTVAENKDAFQKKEPSDKS